MSTEHDEFTTAYLVAALWASTDDTNPDSGGEPLDDNYGIEDIEPDTLAEMILDCRRFQDEPAATRLTAAAEAFGEYSITASGNGEQVYSEAP